MPMRTMIVFAAVAAAAPLAAASPLDGTWKADIASARFSEKPTVYVIEDGTYRCETCTPPVAVPADGKPHAVAGNPYYDMLAVTVVDARTIRRDARKGTKPVGESTLSVSADGKTLTTRFADFSAPNGVPMRGMGVMERRGAAPAGAHAVSGAWVETAKGAQMPAAAITFTYRIADGMVHYATPTGVSYRAKLDGTPAPVTGDPGWTMVTFRRTGPATFVETDLRGTKPIEVLTLTVAPDGQTMEAVFDDKLRGATTRVSFRKQ